MKPKVLKPHEQQTKDQRARAIALIKSLPRDERQKCLTVQIGSSHFQIVIDKKTVALAQDIA
jgi:hypothetical protein